MPKNATNPTTAFNLMGCGRLVWLLVQHILVSGSRAGLEGEAIIASWWRRKADGQPEDVAPTRISSECTTRAPFNESETAPILIQRARADEVVAGSGAGGLRSMVSVLPSGPTYGNSSCHSMIGSGRAKTWTAVFHVPASCRSISNQCPVMLLAFAKTV